MWRYKIGTYKSITWTEADKENNAVEFYSYFTRKGFTVESICGMLGNIDHESWINPGMKQLGGNGRGLIQWTPYTDLTAHIDGEWYDGNEQVDLINREGRLEVSGGARWIKTGNYQYSWKEFSELTDTEECTLAYLYERERAGVEALDIRLRNAQKWYEYFGGTPIPPRPPTPTKRRSMPVYMMCKPMYYQC